ncbi:hypothetical protein HZS_5708 [Henneguya salminicola]|nr:hypothetical protein HZS_5708 [Henneguya salminicola]
MICAINETLNVVHYNSHMFIDRTVRTTHPPFYQFLIVVVFDQETRIYAPCVYGLMTAKNEYATVNFFSKNITLIEYSWVPRTITTEFKFFLMSALKKEFPKTKLPGCYFPLKQAINKKLKKITSSRRDSLIVLSNIELLIVVFIQEINFTHQLLKQQSHQEENLTRFWAYMADSFRFCKLEFFTLINIGTEPGKNNALKRYNRKLKENVGNVYPNLRSFVNIIMRELTFFEERCNKICQNSSGFIFQ